MRKTVIKIIYRSTPSSRYNVVHIRNMYRTPPFLEEEELIPIDNTLEVTEPSGYDIQSSAFVVDIALSENHPLFNAQLLMGAPVPYYKARQRIEALFVDILNYAFDKL